MEIVRASDRGYEERGGVRSYRLLESGGDPGGGSGRFGTLCALNEEVFDPGQGLPSHTHREVEVVTLVVQGEVTLQDAMGIKSVVRAGEVHRMSAGTGVRHSETNLGRGPARFHQVWIAPDAAGRNPGYAQRRLDPASWHNRLAPVA